MHVFVAGSTGVLGRRIVGLLAGQGHQVTALTRRSDRAGLLRSAGADPVVADAFDPVSLAAAVQRAAPDVIMNQLTDLTAGNSAANAALRARAVGAPAPTGSSPAREPWSRGADNHHARTQLAWSPRYPSWRQGFRSMPSGDAAADVIR